MNASLQSEARPFQSSYSGGERAKPAIIVVDGYRWSSPAPANAGEAQSFNEDARRIVDAINGAR